jgi:hypothetical protein
MNVSNYAFIYVSSYTRGLLQKSWQLIVWGQTRYSEESSNYTYERA